MFTQLNIPYFHPLLLYSIAYLSGIGLAYIVMWPPMVYLFCMCTAIVTFAFFTHLSDKIKFLIFGIIFCIITGSARLNLQQYSHSNISKQISGHPINIAATVLDITEQNHIRNRYKISLAIDNLFHPKTHVNNLIFIYSKIKPNWSVGDCINLQNIILKPISNESLLTYFIKENSLGAVFLDKPTANIIYRPSYSILRFFYELRQKIVTNLKKKMTINTFTYFSCLFLGHKKVSRTYDLLKTQCKQWGILHYLARSGLHLVLFAISIELIFSLIPLTYLLKNIFSMLIFFLYFLLTWNSISFMRSLCMILLYKLNVCLNRQINVIHTLTLVTLFILWHNPIQLFFLDFQLSFGITFLLAFFNQIQKCRKLQSYSRLNS